MESYWKLNAFTQLCWLSGLIHLSQSRHSYARAIFVLEPIHDACNAITSTSTSTSTWWSIISNQQLSVDTVEYVLIIVVITEHWSHTRMALGRLIKAALIYKTGFHNGLPDNIWNLRSLWKLFLLSFAYYHYYTIILL